MEGRGGGRKPYDVWDHVVKLRGNRVKCKHCEFQFAAASATRITSHVYSIPNHGIRGCTFGQVANGSGERVKNITRPGNLEAEEMPPKTDLVDVANMAPKKTKKRKAIAVEVEHAKHKVQGLVQESSMGEGGGEESLLSNFALSQKVASSPLDTSFLSSDFHGLRTTSIELKVAGLEEKLDASMARERKLQDEVVDLKVKSEKEKADLLDKILALEGKLKEASMKISLCTDQQVKAKLDSVKSSYDVVAKEDELMVGEFAQSLEKDHFDYEPIYSPDRKRALGFSFSGVNGEHNFHYIPSFELFPDLLDGEWIPGLSYSGVNGEHNSHSSASFELFPDLVS